VGRQGRPDRVVAREALEAATGEERAERELAPVLLADDDHERDPVVARAGDGVDGVAEPGRRVQVDEGGPPGSQCVAARHPHDGAFVKPEHELEIGWEVREKRNLARPGVAEHARASRTGA